MYWTPTFFSGTPALRVIAMSRALGLAAALYLFVALPSTATAVQNFEQGGISASNVASPIAKNVGFDQHMGAQVPLDLKFRDEQGNLIPLKSYFDRGPVILTMAYYGCPNLCTLVLDGLFRGMLELPFNAGAKYSSVIVSIDPSEKPALAAEKKKTYLARKYQRPGGADGIHFLTGDEKEIKALAQAVGFKYEWDEGSKQYAHPAGIIVLTESGNISKYFYGIEYAGKDLRLGLVEASNNKIGTMVDQFLLLCYHYDPAQGAYSRTVLGVLKIGAVLTLLGLGFWIGYLLMQERKKLKVSVKVS
jgi:protein SCO1